MLELPAMPHPSRKSLITSASDVSTDDRIDLQTYVPALINILSTRLSATASATYRSRFDLNVLEWRILVLLANRSGRSAQEIATDACQDKGPVSRALRTLEAKALVDVSAADRGRRHCLSITPAGLALFRASKPIAMERQRKLLSGFSNAEADQLRDFLKRLIAQVPATATASDKSEA